MASDPRAPDLGPEEIASWSFSSGFRGYDTTEVRSFLATVAESHRVLLAALEAADEQAVEIVGAAEAKAAELVREAQDEARRILSEVGVERDRGFAEGAAKGETVLAEAESARLAIEAEAADEAERLIEEAKGARAKVLTDLRRRRKEVRGQVEQLHAAREKLLGALAEVRNTIDATTTGLRNALPEARTAAAAAARRVASEDDPSIEQLDREIGALRLAGLAFGEKVPGDDEGPHEVVPTAGPLPEPEPALVAERRSSAVRIVRPMRPRDPVTGLPEGELRAMEPPDPVETVRLVTLEDVDEEPAPTVPVDVDDLADEAPDGPPLPSEVVEEGDDPVEVVEESEEPVEDGDEPVDVVEDGDEPTEEAAVDEPVDGEADAPEDPAAAADSMTDAETAVPEDESATARPELATVDALFARLRERRAERVAVAEEVLTAAAPDPAIGDAVAANEAVAGGPVSIVTTVDEVVVHRGGGDDRDALLARRDTALVAVTASLGRRLKRLLADEQNELLDALRRVGTADVLPEPLEHAGRWAQASGPDLATAATVGARFFDPGGVAVPPTPGELADAADALATAVAVPLRDRLDTAIRGSEGDAALAAEAVRSAYRTWRADKLGAAAEHAVLAAFALGLASSMPEGVMVCWIVDDGGVPCPDAEDNALAGALRCGAPFPTGHERPPAHPGCRCLMAPVTTSG